jgi:hypothetical protein
VDELALLIRIRNFVRAVRFVLKNGTDSVLYDGKTAYLAYNEVFKEMAFKVLATAMRSKAPVSLLMADMDGLKEINDTKDTKKGTRAPLAFRRRHQGLPSRFRYRGALWRRRVHYRPPGTDKAGPAWSSRSEGPARSQFP